MIAGLTNPSGQFSGAVAESRTAKRRWFLWGWWHKRYGAMPAPTS